MSEIPTTGIGRMEAAAAADMAANAENQARQQRIEDLQQAEQQNLHLLNDVAEFRVYGSNGRTYNHPVTGEVIANAANPHEGRIDEIANNRRYGTTEKERNDAADRYRTTLESFMNAPTDHPERHELAQAEVVAESELNGENRDGIYGQEPAAMFEDGLTVGQVNMIRNARRGERAAFDAQVRTNEDNGMNQADAYAAAEKMYRRRDQIRVRDIYNNAIANPAEYAAFRAARRNPNFRQEAAAQQEAQRQEAERRQEALNEEANAARARLGEPTVEHLRSGVTVIEWLNENGHATRVVELDPRNGRTTVNERDMDADGNVLNYETVGGRQIPALRRQVNYEFSAGDVPQAVLDQIDNDPNNNTAAAITDPHLKAQAQRRDAANKKRARDAAYAAAGGEVSSYVLEPGAQVGESTRVNRGRVRVTNRAGNFLTHGNGTRPGERFTDVIADVEQDIDNGNVLPDTANQAPVGRARRLGRAALRATTAAGRAIQNRRANNANNGPATPTPRQQRRQGRRNLRAAAQARRNGTGLIQQLQQNPPRRNP